MTGKVVCVHRGPWTDALGAPISCNGPVYGEICTIRRVRGPGKYPRRLKAGEPPVEWDQPCDYYWLVGYLGWFLSEAFRPLDQIEQLRELIKTVDAPSEEEILTPSAG